MGHHNFSFEDNSCDSPPSFGDSPMAHATKAALTMLVNLGEHQEEMTICHFCVRLEVICIRLEVRAK